METSPAHIGTCVLSQQVSANAVAVADGDILAAVPTLLRATDKYIIVAMDNGDIEIWDIHGTPKKTLNGSPGAAVWTLAVQGEMLASGGTDNSITVWDLATGDKQKTLQAHTSTIRSLVILNKKKRIISGSRDGTIRVWDVTTGNCTATLTAHTKTVRTMVVASAEDLVLSGSYDGTACIWRITDDGLECLHTLQAHDGAIYCVAFAGDQDLQVVTAGASASIRVWDIEDGKCLAVLQGHSAVVNHAITTSSELITSDTSGSICIWSMGSKPELSCRLETHASSIISMASDGKRIVSGGTDGSVILRNVESRQLLGQLGKATGVWKVDFLEDGRVVLLVLHGGLVMLEIWRVE